MSASGGREHAITPHGIDLISTSAMKERNAEERASGSWGALSRLRHKSHCPGFIGVSWVMIVLTCWIAVSKRGRQSGKYGQLALERASRSLDQIIVTSGSG